MALSIGTNVVIISVVFSVLAILSVLLRFHVRLTQRIPFSIDDYTIIPGLILTVGVGVANCVSAIAGDLGVHIKLNEKGAPEYNGRTVIFMKCLFCTTLLSTPALAFTKCSIVFFYRRIFRGAKFNVITILLIIFIALWGLAMFLGNILTCRPISGNWEAFTAAPTEGGKKAKCFNPVPKYYTSAVCDLFADIIIFIIPQPLVWRLQMPTSRKVAVSAIFVVGAFVLGISAAKISFFVKAGRESSRSYDVTYDQAPTLYWTQLECAIAVICACLPTLRITAMNLTVERLRSYASKLSLRNRSTRKSKASSERSLPRWDGDIPGKQASATSFPPPTEYRVEAVPLQQIGNDRQQPPHHADGSGIVVQKDVYQQRENAV